jgi:hypothetical protein
MCMYLETVNYPQRERRKEGGKKKPERKGER